MPDVRETYHDQPYQEVQDYRPEPNDGPDGCSKYFATTITIVCVILAIVW